jgi:hypothetical protein
MEFQVNLLQTPFAGGNAYKIVSDNVRYDILGKMYALMKLPVRGQHYRFPGNLPVSIERKHMSSVRTPGAYLATEKTDGVRHLLFVTMYDGKKLICMIDRNLDIFHCSFSVYDKLYEGSIFDGELVKTENRFQFNVFDTLAFLGENIMQGDFPRRFECAREFMKMVFPAKTDPFVFQTKGFYHMSDFAKLVEFSKGRDYKTDGFVFYPVVDPYIPFRHWELLKWKPLEKNTVDFLVKPTDVQREFSFGVFDRDRHVEIQKVILPPGILQVEISFYLLEHKEIVVECGFVKSANMWVPILVRIDKKHANDILTFQKTVLNLHENIRLEEFMEAYAPFSGNSQRQR